MAGVPKLQLHADTDMLALAAAWRARKQEEDETEFRGFAEGVNGSCGASPRELAGV